MPAGLSPAPTSLATYNSELRQQGEAARSASRMSATRCRRSSKAIMPTGSAIPYSLRRASTYVRVRKTSDLGLPRRQGRRYGTGSPRSGARYGSSSDREGREEDGMPTRSGSRYWAGGRDAAGVGDWRTTDSAAAVTDPYDPSSSPAHRQRKMRRPDADRADGAVDRPSRHRALKVRCRPAEDRWRRPALDLTASAPVSPADPRFLSPLRDRARSISTGARSRMSTRANPEGAVARHAAEAGGEGRQAQGARGLFGAPRRSPSARPGGAPPGRRRPSRPAAGSTPRYWGGGCAPALSMPSIIRRVKPASVRPALHRAEGADGAGQRQLRRIDREGPAGRRGTGARCSRAHLRMVLGVAPLQGASRATIRAASATASPMQAFTYLPAGEEGRGGRAVRRIPADARFLRTGHVIGPLSLGRPEDGRDPGALFRASRTRRSIGYPSN